MAFHHYTSTVHLPSILGEGVLRPTESNVGSPTQGAHVGPDVVWLLDEDFPSANHGLAGSATNKFEVRITVDVPAVRWTDWEPASRMDPQWREAFVQFGGGPEAAAHWYVWPAPIRRGRWIEIARLDLESLTYSPLA